MRRAALLSCLLLAYAASALRQRRAASGAADSPRSFRTKTDGTAGSCAAHVKDKKLPISFPLLCTGAVTNLTVKAKARGSIVLRLSLSIDGEDKGTKTWAALGGTWEVEHAGLTAGVHLLLYSGERTSLDWVEVQGAGGSCSFNVAPGYDPKAFTNVGLDVLVKVFGPDRDFSYNNKQQLHFAHEALGHNEDHSISATIVSNGVWEWFYMYSKEQSAKDEWLSLKYEHGKMFSESDITPYRQVSLAKLPGRFGDNMTICEPCNALANIVFQEAAVYTSCKGFPFTRDETATLIAGFSGLTAGAAFFHASATQTGALADSFAINLIMYQMHQLVVKSVLANTGSQLTEAERKTILFLDSPAGLAADEARKLTSIFAGDYDRLGWSSSVSNVLIPRFTLSVVATMLTCIESLRGNWPIRGLNTVVNAVVGVLMNMLPFQAIKFVRETFQPAIRKAFQNAEYCGDRKDLIGRFLAFVVTFVEAFIFEEGRVGMPDEIREVFTWLDRLGIKSDGMSDMRLVWDAYNGYADECHKRSPRSTFIEKVPHALMHIQKVASMMLGEVERKCGWR